MDARSIGRDPAVDQSDRILVAPELPAFAARFAVPFARPAPRKHGHARRQWDQSTRMVRDLDALVRSVSRIVVRLPVNRNPRAGRAPRRPTARAARRATRTTSPRAAPAPAGPPSPDSAARRAGAR